MPMLISSYAYLLFIFKKNLDIYEVKCNILDISFRIMSVIIFKGAYASHTPEMGAYGGCAPVSPHFRHSAQRCAPRNNLLPMTLCIKKYLEVSADE